MFKVLTCSNNSMLLLTNFKNLALEVKNEIAVNPFYLNIVTFSVRCRTSEVVKPPNLHNSLATIYMNTVLGVFSYSFIVIIKKMKLLLKQELLSSGNVFSILLEVVKVPYLVYIYIITNSSVFPRHISPWELQRIFSYWDVKSHAWSFTWKSITFLLNTTPHKSTSNCKVQDSTRSLKRLTAFLSTLQAPHWAYLFFL